MKVLTLISVLISFHVVKSDEFYSLRTRLLQSNEPASSFKTLFRGKVVLIVNGASECGYTDSHYKDLYRLQDILGDKHFRVIVFPCNDFGFQEPGSEKDIWDFIWWNYGNVPFLLGEKLSILEVETRHPVYQFLYDSTSILPNWNFYKYLIDHKGKVLGTYSHEITISDLFEGVHRAVKDAQKDLNHKILTREELENFKMISLSKFMIDKHKEDLCIE